MPETPPDEAMAEFQERRKRTYAEWIDEVDHKHDVAHKRLRDGLESLTEQVQNLAHEHKSFQEAVRTLASAPIEAGRMRFTPGALFTIFSAVIVIAGSTWSVNSSVSKLDLKVEAAANLQNERYANLAAAVARAEQQRISDKAEAARLLQKYDNEALAKDLASKGMVKK